jgi:hypothetical protein
VKLLVDDNAKITENVNTLHDSVVLTFLALLQVLNTQGVNCFGQMLPAITKLLAPSPHASALLSRVMEAIQLQQQQK